MPVFYQGKTVQNYEPHLSDCDLLGKKSSRVLNVKNLNGKIGRQGLLALYSQIKCFVFCYLFYMSIPLTVIVTEHGLVSHTTFS